MGIIASLGILLIFFFRVKNSLTKEYSGWCVMFVLYLSIMLSQVVGFPNLVNFKRLIILGAPLYQPIINRIPFSAGFDLSSFLNIIAFIPFGIALAVMWKPFTNFWATFMCGLLFSLMIEISQLFALHRQSDVNDLIMNTTGVMIGWLLVKCLLKWQVQRLNGLNQDWLILLLISVSSVFIFG